MTTSPLPGLIVKNNLYNATDILGVYLNYSPHTDNQSATATSHVHTRFSLPIMIPLAMVLACIILFTLIGNSLVVCAVVSFRRLRSVTNHFVVSLAVADLTVAILVMPYSLLYEITGRWTFDWVFCYFWISCDVTCCTASILHLCVISLDRYLAITQPLTYRRRMSRRRALLMIAGVWLCSGAISFLPIYLGWFANTNIMDLYKDSTECGLFVNRTYAVISSTTSFYFPLVIMFIAYFRIFKIAQKQSMEIAKLERSIGHFSGAEGNRVTKKSKRINHDMKAIRTLGTLMGLFFICWSPFFLMYLIVPFCSPGCYLPPTATSLITWLGYINSSINPCVYAYINRDFRMAFKQLLSCSRYPGRCITATMEEDGGVKSPMVVLHFTKSPCREGLDDALRGSPCNTPCSNTMTMTSRRHSLSD